VESPEEGLLTLIIKSLTSPPSPLYSRFLLFEVMDRKKNKATRTVYGEEDHF